MLPLSTQDTIDFIPRDYDLGKAQELRASAATDADRTAADALIALVSANLDALGGALSAPTYQIRVPSIRARAAWRRDVAQAGARLPANGELFEGLRGALRDVAPANLEELLAKIDLAEAVQSGAADADPSLAREIAALETQMMSAPTYAALVAARTYWFEIAPLLAAAHFLDGWRNVTPKFRKERGLVPESLLAELPPGHFAEIGIAAMNLMAVTKAQEKNSASPSRSQENRQLSAPASDLSTAAPAGGSTASSTTAIPPSTSTTVIAT